ncbi:MAG: hypothetical protein AB7F22_28970 [Reyranella sp.]|uniref:hypothetical protein n=1 Tax=Reyranella sp. TaxID=1929291 RepID=UPI003D1124E7
MSSIAACFDRLLLKRVHADVRKAFPEIRNVVKCVGVTSTRRGQYFVQISTIGRPMFNHDCRAYSATEARCKAWNAFLNKYAPNSDGEAA